MTERNKPYNPFYNGINTYDIDWAEVTLQVVGDKDNFVIYGRRKDGSVIVLNIIGPEVYSE